MGRLTIEPQIFSGEIPPTKSILLVLLELQQRVHYSCRRGLCGQDVIRVLRGAEFLNPVTELEEGTLELLQLKSEPMRLACCTRVIGNGEVVIQVV